MIEAISYVAGAHPMALASIVAGATLTCISILVLLVREGDR